MRNRDKHGLSKVEFLNSHISTEVIESIEFNDRTKQAGVGSVPHVVINGGKQQEFIGGYPDEYFATQVTESQ